jgi:hypothetical protein
LEDAEKSEGEEARDDRKKNGLGTEGRLSEHVSGRREAINAKALPEPADERRRVASDLAETAAQPLR